MVTKLTAPFTKEWWQDAFEATDNETLVDGKLLSYAYLEAGMIEAVAAYVTTPGQSSLHRTLNIYWCCSMVAYFVVFYKNGFSPSDLRRAQKAGSTWFTGLVRLSSLNADGCTS